VHSEVRCWTFNSAGYYYGHLNARTIKVNVQSIQKFVLTLKCKAIHQMRTYNMRKWNQKNLLCRQDSCTLNIIMNTNDVSHYIIVCAYIVLTLLWIHVENVRISKQTYLNVFTAVMSVLYMLALSHVLHFAVLHFQQQYILFDFPVCWDTTTVSVTTLTSLQVARLFILLSQSVYYGIYITIWNWI
jgi:hypothetical protein